MLPDEGTKDATRAPGTGQEGNPNRAGGVYNLTLVRPFLRPARWAFQPEEDSRMRLVIALIVAAACLVPPALASSSPGFPGGPRVEMVRQGPDGFTMRVHVPAAVREAVDLPEGGTYLSLRIPGFDTGGLGEAGRPDLPRRGFSFGLPEGARARVRARVLASTSFSGPPPLPVPARRVVGGDPFPGEVADYQPDAGVYASAGPVPASLVELSPVMGWRHQRVQSVRLTPVQVFPAAGEYRLVTDVEIEVTFDRTAMAPKAPALVPAGPDAPGWDEMMDEMLVNGASAASFRRRLAPRAPVSPREGDQPYFRVRIGTSGFCRIPYRDLEAAGWPEGVSVANVRVEERGFDASFPDPYTVVSIPREVQDTNGDGTFDAGDYLIFYAFNLRDRFHPPFYDDRYTYFHSYWITPSEQGGRDFPEVDGYPSGEGYEPVTSFPYRRHFEKDIHYINNPPQQGAEFLPVRSSFYWLRATDVDYSFRFDVFDPDPEGTYRIRALWQGLYTTPQTFDHFVSLELNSCRLLHDGEFTYTSQFLYDSQDLPIGSCLLAGSNLVRLSGHTSLSTKSTGAFFDWMEVTYDRRLVARQDALEFNTGAHRGKLEFAVTGFTSPDVEVFDVTDPVNPMRLQGDVREEDGSYTLGLRVETDGETRTYYAVVPERVVGLPPSEHPLPADLDGGFIARGLPRDLIAEGAGSDYILVTHPAFRDLWGPLIAQREAQGHRVFLCDVWEIYDQFAGGDKTPRAIQRFLAEAYRNWDPAPTFLLLGGDASEDYRNDTADSDPDWVPTMMHYADVGGTNGKELAGTDNWYVGFLHPGDDPLDDLPEMIVARLPVGSEEEVETITQKILTFENEDPGAAWRQRGYFLVDDQYSTSITGSSGYCFHPNEYTFRTTTEAMMDSIAVLGKLPDFQRVPFFLDAHLDTVQALGRTLTVNDCPNLLRTSQYARENVRPLILADLSRGWLLCEYTGHANKNIITTEQTLWNYPELGITGRDLDRVNNLGKPFVFYGYACHLNEFEYAREKKKGQCIGEYLLFTPNRGAVASFGSTGYEWLPTNPAAQIYTTRALFWNLPRDPRTGRPRRLLGETVTRALVANAMEHGLIHQWKEMLRTYLLLGDPAMRVDVRPADFRVEVNGTPFEEGRLTAASFDDSLAVAVTVSDDVDVSSIRVLDGGAELPPSRLAVTPPDSAAEGAQTYRASFRIALRLGTYDVVVEAADWTGHASRAVLPVVFEAAFAAEGSPLDPAGGNRLDPDQAITVRVSSPVPLSANAFELQLDEEPIPFRAGSLDEAGREWTVSAERIWPGGAHRLVLRTTGGGRTVERSVPFTVSTEELSLLDVYCYPNPCEGGETSLIYELNRSARRASLSIYAVSGRRVLRRELPTRAGRNAFAWRLQDEAGDEVGNGVYLFLLRIEGFDGERIRRLERVAVTR